MGSVNLVCTCCGLCPSGLYLVWALFSNPLLWALFSSSLLWALFSSSLLWALCGREDTLEVSLWLVVHQGLELEVIV